jgi:hypothetical protein
MFSFLRLISYIVFFLNHVKAFFMENITVTIKSKTNDFRKSNYCFNVILCIASI